MSNTSVIKRIDNEIIRRWYEKNWDLNELDKMVTQAEQNGFILNPKSGLLIKQLYTPEMIKNLGHTTIEIGFPRPVDLHYHNDVDEAMHVVNGKGIIYVDGKYHLLCPGRSVYIPKNTAHSFAPSKNDILDLILTLSGIYDPQHEICIKRFDEFWYSNE